MKQQNTASTARTSKRRRGQGMTEYIILTGLIAIALVGAVTKFGKVLNDKYEGNTKIIDTQVVPVINGQEPR